MTPDLFTSFDPAISPLTDLSETLFWSLPFAALALIRPRLSPSSARQKVLLLTLALPIVSSAKFSSTKSIPGLPLLLTAIFIIIITINLSGLLPYTFTTSAHLAITLPLALPLWARFLITGITFAPTKVLGALIPKGAPDFLAPFLVLVESLSTLIRPLTLAFRLTANICAGHLILTVVGTLLTPIIISPGLATLPTLLGHIALFTLEIAVCLIQAYVFTLLLTLYAEEHP